MALMPHPNLGEVVRRHKPPVADNAAITVIEVLGGRERNLTKEFLRLQSHYLFQEHFCLVRTPNEKGPVERLIEFARRNFLVPVPEISSLELPNKQPVERCVADRAERTRGKTGTKADRHCPACAYASMRGASDQVELGNRSSTKSCVGTRSRAVPWWS